MRPLRIAMLATPWEAVPPPRYGGTELVVANLTEELVARGHRVTLFATRDSETSARLVATFPRALYRDNVPWTDVLRPMMHVFDCYRRAEQFDLIHNHANYFGLLFSQLVAAPTVTTYHGDFATAEKIPEKRRMLQTFSHCPLVSISRRQQQLAKTKLHFVGTVYNGIDVAKFPFSAKVGNYLCWLGRITGKKGILESIAVAKKLRLPLKIGGKIDPVDQPFYQQRVRRLIDGTKIQYLGELDQRGKARLLKGALALLNPITWEEPFGLVMPEAMACGTPVVAFARGAAPEIIVHGKTGYLVNDIAGMAAAIKRIGAINRQDCRVRVERYFSKEKMANGYEKIYEKILARRRIKH
ncbi:MAG: glycosyltransferase family 4 protein [Patescibacteria group bacterium]|nr:glycosyltransferase family 4 protein [Patescibacteria group bacterium]